MRLLLIRHGQTPANVLGTLDTAAPGPGLTELGARQAAEVPRVLRDEQVDGIFTSRLVRTQLTSHPLASDRAIDGKVGDGLHEIEAGTLEGRKDHASVLRYLKTAFAWAGGELDVAMPGGHDGHEFFARFDADIRNIEREVGGTAVVFSHGAAIRVWVGGRAVNAPASFAAHDELANTGVVVLEGSVDSGWQLLSWASMPVGGAELADVAAADPTGETIDEAAADAE